MSLIYTYSSSFSIHASLINFYKFRIMPILRSPTKLIMFCHIPKCGGSSIENYCSKIGLEIAFFDQYYTAKPATQKWNISSPQHIDGESLLRLFPENFFDAYFTVVRNPVDRLKSAFIFHKYKAKSINKRYTLSTFIKKELSANAMKYGFHDNHFLPQFKFLNEQCKHKIFKLEDGLSPVKRFIDDNMFGTETDIEIDHVNQAKKTSKTSEEEVYLDEKAKKIITQIYEQDFIRFGYSIS